MELFLFSTVLDEIVYEEWGWQQHDERYEGIQRLDCPDLIVSLLQLFCVEQGRVEAELGLGVVQRDHPDQPVRLDVVGEAGQVRVGGLITIHS